MEATTQIGSIVVIILALCEGIKRAGVPSRYIPLVSLVVGIIAASAFGGANFLSVSSGVLLGLSSTGLFRVIKTSILNK